MPEIPEEVRRNSQNFFRNPAGQIKERGTNRVVFDPNAGGGGDSGGGDGGGQRSLQISPGITNAPAEAFLSPTDFLKLARLQAESQIGSFQPDIPKLRDLAAGQVSPFFESARGVLDVQGQIGRQQAAITRGQISRNFDNAFEQLQESYNSRGLFFSGEELEAEGDLLTRRAEELTSQDLRTQELILKIEQQKGQLSLQEKQEIEKAFQTLLTSDESAFNVQKEAAINRILASVVPSFVEARGNLERSKLVSQERSRVISDELSLQTLDQRSQTFPLELALKMAKVEQIPIDQALQVSQLALREAQVNRIPLEDAIQIANLELKQANVANIPLNRQILETRLSQARQNLRLGVAGTKDFANYAEGLNNGLVKISSVPAKNRNAILEAGRAQLQNEMQMSIAPDEYLKILGETQAEVGGFLDFELEDRSEVDAFNSFVNG